jgi:hypothetical protein
MSLSPSPSKRAKSSETPTKKQKQQKQKQEEEENTPLANLTKKRGPDSRRGRPPGSSKKAKLSPSTLEVSIKKGSDDFEESDSEVDMEAETEVEDNEDSDVSFNHSSIEPESSQGSANTLFNKTENPSSPYYSLLHFFYIRQG